MVNVNKALYSLLSELFCPPYDAKNIIIGNQNNWKAPQNNEFIIYTGFDVVDISNLIESNFNHESNTNIYIKTVLQDFSIDFYGTPAEQEIKNLKLVLESYANVFFKENSFQCHIVTSGNIINLTDIIDTDMYIERYNLRFKVSYDIMLGVKTDYITSVEIDSKLILKG